MARSQIGKKRDYFGWDRARLSVLVPVGVVVVGAIISVVVAVQGSADRADAVAVEREQQLFMRTLFDRGERVLNEVESVAASERAVNKVRLNFDRDWVERRVGLWLQSHFEHDMVFVADASSKLIYASLGRRSVDPNWFNGVRPDLVRLLDLVRRRTSTPPPGTLRVPDNRRGTGSPPNRAALLESFVGRPAIVAAVLVASPDDPITASDSPPVVISVRFIDRDVLNEISMRTGLRNLHLVNGDATGDDEDVFKLADASGGIVARYAWDPSHPGAEIVHNVLPFIVVALAAFAVLIALVLRYMRRTSAAIAAGENRLRHLAMHDPLCGLPNRVYFSDRLEAAIQDVRQGVGRAAVFYVDLDHFKDVNDTLGHPIGDELIRGVSERLTRTVRADDLVARLGGDEFAVLTTSSLDGAGLLAVANRIINVLCVPYLIGNQQVVIGASIGIAVIDSRSETPAEVMRHADLALYRAKNEGRNRACVYDQQMDADLVNRKFLEGDLRAAIENRELRVAYQPIVNNSGDKVVGVEALCRWTHPTRGEIPPAEFIPIAEASGLIVPLGDWMLRQACIDSRAWPDIMVAVNVSPLQLRRTDFADMVVRILNETSLDPSRLELEVTESILLGNVETAEAAIERLKALGIRLALDDFGTGYSSLQYLRRFPFDKLKVDSSFVRSIEIAADAAAIVHAVVSLGRGLGMKVTAEGVETAEQQLFLRAAGVHSMQGYRFGAPVAAAQISRRLEPVGVAGGEFDQAIAS